MATEETGFPEIGALWREHEKRIGRSPLQPSDIDQFIRQRTRPVFRVLARNFRNEICLGILINIGLLTVLLFTMKASLALVLFGCIFIPILLIYWRLGRMLFTESANEDNLRISLRTRVDQLQQFERNFFRWICTGCIAGYLVASLLFKLNDGPLSQLEVTLSDALNFGLVLLLLLVFAVPARSLFRRFYGQHLQELRMALREFDTPESPEDGQG